MKEALACIFETSIGPCGLIWSKTEIVGLALPEQNKKILKERLNQRESQLASFEEAPLWVKKIIARLQKHLEGKSQDFSKVPVGFPSKTEFQKKVYQVVRKIPPGQVLTYKEVGLQLGKPGASRAIGSAMGKNPIPLIIPCHRVVGSAGKPGGFTAHGGLTTKTKLLKLESFLLKLKG